MKKIILIFLAFFISIFLLPIIFTKTNNKLINNFEIDANQSNIDASKNETSSSDNQENNDTNSAKNDNENNMDLGDYDYKNYKKIRLLHASSGEIEEIGLDEYLLGVVSAEMPATFNQEALNAQAIVARTYTLYTISHNSQKHNNADICDDSKCCQAWISKSDRLAKWDKSNRDENWNKIELAVKNTIGKVITYQGELIDAFFHANSGGITETPVNVWGGTNYPYLQSVQTSGEDAYSQFSSEVDLTKEEFTEKIKQKHQNLTIDYNDSEAIKITEYDDSGRVKTIKIGNLHLSGVELRTIIGLKSTNFTVEIENDNIKFKVIGYGHGVGMSQTGADAMAKTGSNFEDIIKHFYTGIEIVDYK